MNKEFQEGLHPQPHGVGPGLRPSRAWQGSAREMALACNVRGVWGTRDGGGRPPPPWGASRSPAHPPKTGVGGNNGPSVSGKTCLCQRAWPAWHVLKDRGTWGKFGGSPIGTVSSSMRASRSTRRTNRREDEELHLLAQVRLKVWRTCTRGDCIRRRPCEALSLKFQGPGSTRGGPSLPRALVPGALL